MLRGFVIALAAASLLGAAAVMLFAPRLWPLAVEWVAFAILLSAGLFFERHYRGAAARPKDVLQSTGEKFVDPSTGKLTEVLYDPKTGERIYREKSGRPS